MNMSKRLNKIERELSASKEAENELEIIVNADTENEFYSLSPDGSRKEIDYNEASKMMEHDNKPCEVLVTD